MRKLSLFLMLFALLFASTTTAKPIDRSVALTAAQKIATTQFAIERATPELVYTGQNDAYYVFNLNDHSFVIIAGDDAHRPVIGYSDQSAFDASNIPPALSYYLDGVAECIGQLRSAVATSDVAAEWASVLQHGRLISRHGGRSTGYFCQTQWNQTYPYNYCCPEDPAGSGGHAIVGCLATAMSQLMRFWAYPAKGIGNHCYHHSDYGEICADFGNTNYDWDNMPNVLNNNSTEAEKLATGTLCFHCGVTIDMGYGPDGSGGASGPIPGAMNTYFDYCDAIVQLRRNDYETETWKTMVREQFDMGWPMYSVAATTVAATHSCVMVTMILICSTSTWVGVAAVTVGILSMMPPTRILPMPCSTLSPRRYTTRPLRFPRSLRQFPFPILTLKCTSVGPILLLPLTVHR